MNALRRPLTFWVIALGVAAAAMSAWLFSYFLQTRWTLAQGHLSTVRQQVEAIFAAGSPPLLRLWLASPWLAALLALACVPLAWLAARGRRGALVTAALSVAALPAIYLVGMMLLRRLEDRIFFPRSHWVWEFRVGCAALAAALLVAVVWAAAGALRRPRLSAAPADTG